MDDKELVSYYVRCPNESYQIKRAICQARQARGYPKCRKCKYALN